MSGLGVEVLAIYSPPNLLDSRSKPSSDIQTERHGADAPCKEGIRFGSRVHATHAIDRHRQSLGFFIKAPTNHISVYYIAESTLCTVASCE